MSPAIITETVWALANPVGGGQRIVPDEIVVITTARGAEDLRKALLTPKREWGGRAVWECLREAILGASKRRAGQKPPRNLLQLASARVIELPDAKSGVKQPAADLRSAADNAAAADFILEEVRRLTENPDNRVIASLAGGRKTMGALLYAAMSLLGHETDRVTHVLVNDPFETCRDFFYPNQPPAQELFAVAGGERRVLRAADARIELADVPFVPLRNLFEHDLARLPGGFVALVERCSHRVSELARRENEIQVCEDRPEVIINHVRVPLSVDLFLVMCIV
jgi:CRISPR-associated protein (TIGR02584 family)